MDRLLIAVKSCRRDADRGYHDIIRKTWGRDVVGADVLYFMGRDGGDCSVKDFQYHKEDEVKLYHALDDYDSLPYKTKEILRFSLAIGYDFTFLCDTDTFVIPSRLLSCGYERYDISGRFGQTPELGTTFRYNDGRGNVIDPCHPWPSGGVGYFLSRAAAEVISDLTPTSWAEDLWVGQVMGPLIQSGKMSGKDLDEFEGRTAWHFPRKAYNNQVYDPSFGWMEKMYAEQR